MRHKLAITPALVAALTLGALTVHTTDSPRPWVTLCKKSNAETYKIKPPGFCISGLG
jgi:hypothetical protein